MNRSPIDDFDEDDTLLYDALKPLREITPPGFLQDECVKVISNSEAPTQKSSSNTENVHFFGLH